MEEMVGIMGGFLVVIMSKRFSPEKPAKDLLRRVNNARVTSATLP